MSVGNTRPQKRSNQIWRRRQCADCLAIFTSHEAIDPTSALMVQASNKPAESFMADKLFTEILLALQDRKNCYTDAREITATATKQLLKLPGKPVFKPSDISKTVSEVLKRFDKRAWLRYQAEHPSLLT